MGSPTLQSASDCEKLPAGMVHSCYADVALKNLDTSVCDKIPDSDLFLFGCYARIAIAKDDLSVCGGVRAGEDTKENNVLLCKEEVANECSCYEGVKEEHPAICSQVASMGMKGACA